MKTQVVSKKNQDGNMLAADRKRFGTPARILLGVLMVAAVALMSVKDCLHFFYIGADYLLKLSTIDQLQMSMTFERFKPLLILAASIFTVPSIAQDIKKHYLSYLIVRKNLASYVRSRVLANSCYVLLVMSLGFLIAGICMSPFTVIETKGYTHYGIFQPLAKGEFAWVYLIVMSLNFGLAVLPICNLGMLLSVWKPNVYVALGGTFFSFYLLNASTNFFPYFLSFNYLSSEPDLEGIWMNLYHILIFTLLNALTGWLLYRALKRKFYAGNL